MFVNIKGDISEQEQKAYVKHAMEKCGDALEGVDITLEDDDTVQLDYHLKTVPFERIRRITGYLVGTVDRWNDAKQAEEKDRVKHSV